MTENNQTNDPVLEAMLAQKRAKEASKNGETTESSTPADGKLTGKQRVERMFIPREERVVVRIIPPAQGAQVFQEMHFHTLRVNGKFEKIYCTSENDGGKCPLCDLSKEILRISGEKRKKLLAQTSDQMPEKEKKAIVQPATDIFKLGKDYEAKRFYVLEVVRRGDKSKGEQDSGKLFWRFRDRHDGKGVYDMIMAIIEEKGNIVDAQEGRDLIIRMHKNQKGFMEISSITPDDRAPIFPTDAQLEVVQNDPTDAKDIFVPKAMAGMTPEEYMRAVINNEVPVWDSHEKKYVKPDNSQYERITDLIDGLEGFTSQASPAPQQEAPASQPAPAPVKEERDAVNATDFDNTEDLPF